MKIKLSLFLLLFAICSYGQSWFPMGNGMTRDLLPPWPKSRVYSISSINDSIIATGEFKKADNKIVNGIAFWSGYEWESLGLGMWNDAIADSLGYVSKVAFYNGKMFGSGTFSGAGGSFINDPQHVAGNIAKWDGTDWNPLSPPSMPTGVNNTCGVLKVYNNNLYLGGIFAGAYDSSGTISAHGIAKWNDTVFSSVGYLASNYGLGYYWAVAFTEYNNKLIVGGFFNSIDSSPFGTYGFVASWNDTIWDTLGSGLNAPVYCFTVFNGELYAGGEFTATADGTPANHIAKWNGTQWLPVGEGLNDTVLTLCVDSLNNKLIAGGKFTQTGLGQPAKHIAEWNGTNWQEIGGGTNAPVWTLFAKDSNLYVGGEFTQAGSISANCIAVWGNNPVSINEISKNDNLTIYPNPSNNEITIVFENASSVNTQITIQSVLGQTVYSESMRASIGKQTKTLDISSLQNGLYFVQLKAHDVVYSVRFIKQ
ncbi:MAG: T9SS type A sorting domain-containing protein [Bacteroidia bacterium]|nr:T9SS type A sorting domain-containing protein [Bacteroidia bacterium]